MDVGTIVFLNWYDFDRKAEHVCRGEVVDNSTYNGTQYQDYVNVRFQPPHMQAPVCRHFRKEKLSLTQDGVPHDDCTLVFAKRIAPVYDKASTSDAWQQVQQFKNSHWDYQNGHISIDALPEFYNLWRTAITTKLGVPQNGTPFPRSLGSDHPVPSAVTSSQPLPAKRSKKQKSITGSITYQDSVQTSFFE